MRNCLRLRFGAAAFSSVFPFSCIGCRKKKKAPRFRLHENGDVLKTCYHSALSVARAADLMGIRMNVLRYDGRSRRLLPKTVRFLQRAAPGM